MSEDSDKIVEIVITAPEPFGSALAYCTQCRTTMGVLMQLIVQAKNRIVIAAPFIQAEYGKPAEVIRTALAQVTAGGVSLQIISSGAGLQGIEQLLKSIESKHLVHVFSPHAELTNGNQLGLHAKFCVVDGERAYVGSANLTGPGLGRHLEMGVLVNGYAAKQIEDFWRYCIEIGVLVRLHNPGQKSHTFRV
jgi:phosphatidylserine/phosphatidylglycerophosphate/cardiolipin synthase-like enzyme